MIQYLQKLTGTLFYILGGTFFLAYLAMVHDISPLGQWWLSVADLPLIFVGMLYGGSSLYLSVKPKDSDSKTLFITIGIPLVALFSTFLIMNFWEVFTLI